MLGDRITKLSHLLNKVKPEILIHMNKLWTCKKSELKDGNIIPDEIKEDIITAYKDKTVFKKVFDSLRPIEKNIARYIAEIPSGMSIKDIVSEISKTIKRDRKSVFNVIKNLFTKYFCIPLKSDSDTILFIPKEFRYMTSKLDEIDDIILHKAISTILPNTLDRWRIKEIANNLDINSTGYTKQISDKIAKETTFENLMTALYKNEIGGLINYINEEYGTDINKAETKPEMILQLRKYARNITNTVAYKVKEHQLKPIRIIVNDIEEYEITYHNQEKVFPARKITAYLYYSNHKTVPVENVYNTFCNEYYKNIGEKMVSEALDMLCDEKLTILESDKNNSYIRLNEEFLEEPAIHIESFFTAGTNLDSVYEGLRISEKYVLSTLLNKDNPFETDLMKQSFDTRFKQDIFNETITTLIEHNIIFSCCNDDNTESLSIPQIYRKKLNNMIISDNDFQQISELVNIDIQELYDIIDRKEVQISSYEKRIQDIEDEIKGMESEYNKILNDDIDINKVETANERDRLLYENSQLVKRNKQLRNDLMEIRSKIIVYDDVPIDINAFRNASIDKGHKDVFCDMLLLLLQNIGLSAKLNTTENGPEVISIASAPDTAIMIDFAVGKKLDDELYPFGLHFQSDEYIYKSELKDYTKVLKLFIANEFPESYSIIRLAKQNSVKLVRVEQMINLFEIYHTFPISQHDIVKIFTVEDMNDIFIKDWQIEELNKQLLEKKIRILRSLLIYNELYKSTDYNYTSRDAEGIYNSVKQVFRERGLEPASEQEIYETLKSFSNPLIQLTENKEDSEHFTPLLKPDTLIKQIKFLNNYLQEISNELIIDDLN